jgi:uncharacterized protein YbjT (DUF2867 family)
MDNANKVVTIFGGSGFLGTQVVQVLARKGYRIRVAVRRPDLAGHVKPLGMVGQIMPIQANVRNAESVRNAVVGADIVINLTGIAFERGRQRFRAVQAMGARNVAEAAKAAGVTSLVQVSYLGATIESPSAYARTKAMGEAEVLGVFPETVILRLPILFGQNDAFFNTMGFMARMLPVLPVVSAKSRFQPLYVGDAADALGAAATGAVKGGRAYELGGPEVVTSRELTERVVRATNRHNLLVPIPNAIAKLIAFPFALLPFKPLLTGDQVDLLSEDSVVSPEAIRDQRALNAFGIEPTPMDAILSTYLWRFRRHGQFDRIAA